MLLTLIFSAILAFELLLCLIVYYASLGDKSNSQKQLRHRFYLFNIFIALWSLCSSAYGWSNSTTFWDYIFRIATISAIGVGISFLLFTKSLTKEKLSKLSFVSYSVLVIGSLVVSIFLNIGHATFQESILIIQINPLLDGFVSVVPVILVIHGIYILERFARHNKQIDQKVVKQAKFVSRGMSFVLLTFVVCNYLLPAFGVNSSFVDIFAAIVPLIYIFIIGFSVFSLKLFNFSSFLYKAIAYIAALAVVFAIYTTVAILVAQYLLGIQLDTKTELILAIFSAITALVFQPLKKFFDKITNAIFYRDAYDAQAFLNQVNNKIVNTVDLYELLNSTAKIVTDNINVEFCDFYIDEKSSIDFHVAGTNPKIFGENGWEKLDELIDKSTQKVFTITEETDEVIAELMRKLKVETIAKMMSQDQHVGYLIVGQKRSGNKSTKQDTQMVEIIADEVAIAVQNSLRFIEIAQFNITLQKKIEIATAELQKSNEKLVELDEAKDEFISMASHQLRTPLTSVKGYISMLQEGDAGEVNEQQQNFLNQAFLSSQRMVYLIADLLNVSRLKTGKFVIDAKPTYLPDVIDSEIAQLTETVKARGLEMKFDKPNEFPTLNLDETKIRQVIMNFADNAIYYTPKGGLISIKLQASDKTIEFSVTDTGIGVPKSEQHKLFAKFYRAGNARKARPDGTGLGLFMAKKVVIAQGGAIIFKTTEGKGSTFGFSFPREKIEIKK